MSGLKIIHFVGGLNFASRDSFKELFVQKIGMDPAAVLRKRTKLREKVINPSHKYIQLPFQFNLIFFYREYMMMMMT